jgi:hypothetical protein
MLMSQKSSSLAFSRTLFFCDNETTGGMEVASADHVGLGQQISVYLDTLYVYDLKPIYSFWSPHKSHYHHGG